MKKYIDSLPIPTNVTIRADEYSPSGAPSVEKTWVDLRPCVTEDGILVTEIERICINLKDEVKDLNNKVEATEKRAVEFEVERDMFYEENNDLRHENQKLQDELDEIKKFIHRTNKPHPLYPDEHIRITYTDQEERLISKILQEKKNKDEHTTN